VSDLYYDPSGGVQDQDPGALKRAAKVDLRMCCSLGDSPGTKRLWKEI
jgi:hypothetical protein